VPLLFNVPIDSALDTPAPPVAAPEALEPAPPVIVPLLLIVVAGQLVTSTPSEPVTSAEPAAIPVVVIVMAPPLLRTGPVVDVEMIWFGPEHAASARSGAAKAAPRATSEAPRAAKGAPPLNGGCWKGLQPGESARAGRFSSRP